MRFGFAIVLSTAIALTLWAALVVFSVLGGWFHRPLAPPGNTPAFFDAAVRHIESNHRGNVAFVLIENGEVVGTHFTSIGEPVDGDTLFQVASLSKWIAACGVMTLVESGRLDLDVPVSSYLTRWALPESKFDNAGVTVRRLLSHTAGLTDRLGYAGFPPESQLQTLEQSLTEAADPAWEAVGPVRVGNAPGSKWQYSGGGYTLLQLLVEEVSGESFEEYMQRAVLQPLGMTRSTFDFEKAKSLNVATFYDVDGTEATHFRFTALAAASLYTTTSDLTKFVKAFLPGPNGEEIGRGVLQPDTLTMMRQPQAWVFGIPVWGLGVVLYAPTQNGSFIIGHDGLNSPAINTTARMDPETGDGIIVLTTGSETLAGTVAGEWTFWQTGRLDLLMVSAAVSRMVMAVAAGAVIIVLISSAIAWHRWRRRHGKVAATPAVG